MVASFNDTEEPKKIQGQGFEIAGIKYITIKADERSLYGKQVHSEHPVMAKADSERPHWSPQGKEGVVIVKTTKAILVAHYPENVVANQAATTVEQLGDYLIKVGF